MTIGIKCLTDKLSTCLSNLSSLSLDSAAVLSSAVNNVNTTPPDSVPCAACLPFAANNLGRLIYVTDQSEYRYSDGEVWIRTFDTTVQGAPRCAQIYTFGNRNDNKTIAGYQTGYASVPTLLSCAGTNWSIINAYSCNAAGIKNDGTLWTWGAVRYGVLGNNSSGNVGIFQQIPGTVVGGGNNWCLISVGSLNMAAIKTNGTLWGWGSNSTGLLGDGTTTNRSSPVTVAGGGTTWCTATVGAGIKIDGTLWTWGSAAYGRLGNGQSAANRSSPGTVVGGSVGSNWASVHVGVFGSSFGVKTDGTLWTWGRNNCGQLGDGTTTSRSSPGTVAGGGTNWLKVDSAPAASVAARKSDGTLWTWGYNAQGQLGDGTTTSRSSPGTVAGGGTNWKQVSMSQNHTVGTKTDGTLWTWGNNSPYRQLGTGDSINRSSPGTVSGGGTTWVSATALVNASMALCNSSSTFVGF